MSIALLYISDGRVAYSEHTLRSALVNLPKFDQYIFVDDADHRLGFNGAVAAGWAQVSTDYVFHLEQDFTFNFPAPVQDMLRILEARPEVAQVSLKRQAWNNLEKAAGGIVEANPQWFTEVNNPALPTHTQHRVYFTTNPSLYRVDLCRMGWPQVPHSEGTFTHIVLSKNPATVFAIHGAKYAAPAVHHIGDSRAGGGY